MTTIEEKKIYEKKNVVFVNVSAGERVGRNSGESIQHRNAGILQSSMT